MKTSTFHNNQNLIFVSCIQLRDKLPKFNLFYIYFIDFFNISIFYTNLFKSLHLNSYNNCITSIKIQTYLKYGHAFWSLGHHNQTVIFFEFPIQSLGRIECALFRDGDRWHVLLIGYEKSHVLKDVAQIFRYYFSDECARGVFLHVKHQRGFGRASVGARTTICHDYSNFYTPRKSSGSICKKKLNKQRFSSKESYGYGKKCCDWNYIIFVWWFFKIQSRYVNYLIYRNNNVPSVIINKLTAIKNIDAVMLVSRDLWLTTHFVKSPVSSFGSTTCIETFVTKFTSLPLLTTASKL